MAYQQKFYGLWIKAQHPGSVVFINPNEEVETHRENVEKGKAIQHKIAFQNVICHAGAKGGTTMLIEDSVKVCPTTDL